MSTDQLATVDLTDADLYGAGDPLTAWARLRATTPVFWNPQPDGPGFWAVMTYQPALRIYRDPTTFTSEQGIRLDADRAAVGAAAGKMLIVTDPPHHTRLRQLMSSVFRPAGLARLTASMRAAVEPLIEDAMGRDHVEFVSEIAAVLPAAIICDLMDVPQADRPTMITLTSRAFGASLGGPARTSAMSALDKAEAHAEIFMYYTELVEERRGRPGDDLVSALIQGEVDGRRLTDEEVLLNCDGLLTGANETTRHASVGGLLGLIEQPGAWRLLRSGQVDLDVAVDEILRYTSPAMHVKRVATTDVMVGDQQVRRGEAVAIWNPSANRDESVFADPDRLDLTRRPNRHLTFGHGPHNCLGGMLARLELRVLLETLRTRVTRLEQAGPAERLYSSFIWGFERLPVTLR